MSDVLSESDIRELQGALNTPEGRSTIAQTMLEPFKLGRDYVAIGRQCFAVDHLPAGAPMWYDLDPQFVAAVVGPKGGVNLTEVETTRIQLEPIILAVYPKIHVLDVATRRFNILDREQERAQHVSKFVLSKLSYMRETPKISVAGHGENTENVTMDNPQERRENIDYVTCKVCGKQVQHIGNHLRLHALTKEAYLKRYPESRFCSAAYLQRREATYLARYGATNPMKNKECRALNRKAYLQTIKQNAGERKMTTRVNGAVIRSASVVRSVHPASEQMRKVWEKRKLDPNAFYKKVEFRRLKSEQTKALWANPEYKKKIRASRQQKFNKLERAFAELIGEGVRFCGYGMPVVLNDKVFYPDFVSRSDSSKVIEVFGSYWHGPKKTGMPCEQHEKEVLVRYAEAGYSCLVVWDYEMKDLSTLKQRVDIFLESSETACLTPKGDDTVQSSPRCEANTMEMAKVIGHVKSTDMLETLKASTTQQSENVEDDTIGNQQGLLSSKFPRDYQVEQMNNRLDGIVQHSFNNE